MLVMLRFKTYPLDPTSNGTNSVFHSAFMTSFFRSLYLSCFVVLAESILLSNAHVSSNSLIYFCSLYTNTRSGLEVVVRISGGIVPPLKSRPGKSEYISKFSGLDFINSFVRWLNTEL